METNQVNAEHYLDVKAFEKMEVEWMLTNSAEVFSATIRELLSAPVPDDYLDLACLLVEETYIHTKNFDNVDGFLIANAVHGMLIS